MNIQMILASFTIFIAQTLQANSWVELAPDEFAVKNFPKDSPFRFVGKYMGLVQNNLQLFDFPMKLELENPKLARSLAQFVPGTTNLIIEGYLQVQPNNRGGSETIIRVSSLTPGPGDLIVFEKRLKELLKEKKNNSASLLRLSEKIYKTYKKFNNPKLLPTLGRSIKRAYVLRQKHEDATTSESQIALLQEIFKRIPQKEFEGHFYADLSKKYPGHPVIRNKLKKLGYRQRQGRWLSIAQFKQEEGFIWNGRTWVKEAGHHFQLVLKTLQDENITNLILRRRTEREYKQLSEKGKLEIGMNHQEVALTMGFPDRVHRHRLSRQTELDQWDFGDRRIYFFKGELIAQWKKEDLALFINELRTLIRNGGQMDSAPR